MIDNVIIAKSGQSPWSAVKEKNPHMTREKEEGVGKITDAKPIINGNHVSPPREKKRTFLHTHSGLKGQIIASLPETSKQTKEQTREVANQIAQRQTQRPQGIWDSDSGDIMASCMRPGWRSDTHDGPKKKVTRSVHRFELDGYRDLGSPWDMRPSNARMCRWGLDIVPRIQDADLIPGP